MPAGLSRADEQSLNLIERAVADLRKLGATIVDPGPGGALFQSCIVRHAPALLNAALARRYPQLFPADGTGRPASDWTAILTEMAGDPSKVPPALTLLTVGGGFGSPGEEKYEINKYLRERGDANVRSHADLIAKATFYSDPNFPDRKQARENTERAMELDTSARLHSRFAVQTTLLQCMEEQQLTVLVSPTSTVPPRKLTSPREPTAGGRPPIGWSLFGQQGFPAMTVPAGFTTEVWDREREGGRGTRLIGPIAAQIPVGLDFIARPFDEATLVRIGSAFEAATKHRRPPPDFGALAGR
jgi:Asp-tRNA(Asn)/Glu-tRNA(Gln) amidotransferase A subunit family amidase